MPIFEALGDGYEQIVFGHDKASGLKTIIAIYSTARGPALGGTRFYPYPDEDSAFRDALRLGKAMAYKAACADLSLGGGKAVIIGDPSKMKTPELIEAYARIVDSLGGRYLTCADVGTDADDLDVIGKVTPHVTGTHAGSGDPSPVTAYGIWHGMRAVAEEALGDSSLSGKHVVLVGTGKVGGDLARRLASEGARLTLADVNTPAVEALAKQLSARVVDPLTAHTIECDVFAPCALGGILNAETIPDLACKAVAGAANNQLATRQDGQRLAERGILYAPDFVINAGGLINAEDERHGYDSERAHAKAAGIADTLRLVFARAKDEGCTPAEAADRLAEDRIAEATRARGW
jgi:glutamate dehydrogenase/leucine dehydrogenase